jgi:hypothetical protein
VIQRTFNSKNTCNEWLADPYRVVCSGYDENTWLGYGWTLHLGRLFYSINANLPHVIEMSDGSRHPAYLGIGINAKYITKDYWLFDASTKVLTLTNGTKVCCGQSYGGETHGLLGWIYYL